MMEAAEAGDRGAMVYIGRAFETGDGLGTLRYYCTIIIIRGGVGGETFIQIFFNSFLSLKFGNDNYLLAQKKKNHYFTVKFS